MPRIATRRRNDSVMAARIPQCPILTHSGRQHSTILDMNQSRFRARARLLTREDCLDRATIIADFHVLHARKRPRYLVWLNDLQIKLDV